MFDLRMHRLRWRVIPTLHEPRAHEHGGDDETGGLRTMLIRVAARASEISGIRARVRAFVAQTGGDDRIADDLELVVSELATNVIEHTSADTISVLIERDDAGWTMQVADADDASMLDRVSLPPATARSGRGLFVVRSLVDTLELIETASARAVRCTLSAS
jgi:anti-sigma regulatory factor (Ser/Thr protein kinase)